MNATEIIQAIVESGVRDKKAILDVLEDGEALKSFGITDEDQTAVEGAHWMLKNDEHLSGGAEHCSSSYYVQRSDDGTWCIKPVPGQIVADMAGADE